MTHSIPAETLQNIVAQDERAWQRGPMSGKEDTSIRWIPVADVGRTKLHIGLSDEGEWVRGGGATVEVANGPHALSFLPCLDVPLEEVRQTIRNGLVRIGLPSSFADTFPLANVIVTGLTSGSEYWVTLALERIDDSVRNEQVDEAIRSASTSAPTQKLRHQAKRLLGKPVR
ncbi:hypothetical protein [Schlesneria sp. T3-172]|uniref:hypothetical protein n=1 Tax=Schlesneria sphaerica TaxID=3373610 RepID=UPI0037C7FBC5